MAKPARHVPSGGLADHYYALATDSGVADELREAAARFALADAELRCEHGEDGLKLAEEALELFRTVGHEAGIGDSLRLVIHAHCLQNDREAADEILEEELGNARDEGDEVKEAKLLLSRAELNADRRGSTQREEALQAATRARSVFHQQREKRMEATACLALIVAKLKNKDTQNQSIQEVERLAEDSLSLFQEVGDKRGTAMAHHWRAVALAALGRVQTALASADSARALFQEAGDRILEARELQVIASWCLDAGAVHLALPAAEEAFVLFREQGCSDVRVTTALQTLVRCLIAGKNSQQALALADGAAAEAREKGNQRAEADALLLVSQGYINLAKETAPEGDPENFAPPEEAVTAAEKALDIVRDLGDEEGEARIATLISNLQLRRREFEKASYSAQEALWMFEDVKDAECHAAALQALMGSHLSKKEYKDAVQAAYETRDVFKNAGDQKKEAQTMLTVAEIQYEQRKIDEAVTAAREAQSLFHEAGDRKGEGKAMQYIAELRNLSNEPERALFAAERARSHLQRLGDEQAEARMLLLAVQNRISAIEKKQLADSRLTPAWEEIAKAARDSKELVALCQKIGDKQLEGAALCSAAQVHAFNDRSEDAIEAADQAISLFVVAEDVASEAAARVLCANLYLSAGELRKSVDEAKEALLLFQEQEDAEGARLASEVLDRLREFEFRVDDLGGLAPARAATGDASDGKTASAGRQAERDLVPAGPAMDSGLVMSTLQQVTKKMLGSENDIEVDLPLFDIGINSMNAVLFRNKMLDEFEGVDLPVTLVFDFPTLRGMSDLVLAKG